eukprot:ANDGO_07564.mRNA.1 hypothetical protein
MTDATGSGAPASNRPAHIEEYFFLPKRGFFRKASSLVLLTSATVFSCLFFKNYMATFEKKTAKKPAAS